MACKHLKALFELCQNQGLRLGSSDLIRIMCTECGTEEVCPSVLYDQYEAKHNEPSSGGALSQNQAAAGRIDPSDRSREPG